MYAEVLPFVFLFSSAGCFARQSIDEKYSIVKNSSADLSSEFSKIDLIFESADGSASKVSLLSSTSPLALENYYIKIVKGFKLKNVKSFGNQIATIIVFQ